MIFYRLAISLLLLSACRGPELVTRPGQPFIAKETGTLPWRPLQAPPPMTVVALHSNQPTVSFRFVFHTGSVDDPVGKEGLTALTARLLTEGGTQKLSSAELLQALFPMAAELSVRSDKEFTTFEGRVHKDFVDRFLEIFTDVLLEPRFDPREFERLQQDAVNAIRSGLRGEDDELLGKVALDALLYPSHPYGHYTEGTVEGLKKVTLEDIKAHTRQVFTQDRLVIGLAGSIEASTKKAVLKRLAALPKSGAALRQLPTTPVVRQHVVIVRKDALSTAVSMGFAFSLRRGDPDFFPIAFGLSYLGEHRQLMGLLFGELREKRGLNYGDYAYIEHFIQEGQSTYAATNIGRSTQDFSIWLRPVEPENAVFAAKGAVYYLRQLLEKGFEPDRFETVRGFLLGYTRLWEQTDERRLGYAIDSLFYGCPDFLQQFRAAVQRMSPAEVQAAMRRHLDPSRMNFAFVAQDADALTGALRGKSLPKIHYASPKSPEVLEEDEKILKEPLLIDPSGISVIEASGFMQASP